MKLSPPSFFILIALIGGLAIFSSTLSKTPVLPLFALALQATPSEIGWIGVNSRTLSSKRAPLMGKGVQRMSLNRSSSAGGTTGAADRAAQRASHNDPTRDNGTKT